MVRVHWLQPVFCLFLGILASQSVSLNGQEPAKNVAAQLEAMIDSIAPYRPGNSASGTVRVFSSGSMDVLAHGWTTGFKRFHSKADVLVHGAGADQAFAELVKAPSAIAILSRPVREEELADLKRQGLKSPVAIPVAREALAVYVHESNPVNAIDGKQLKSIFTDCQYTPVLTWEILKAPANWAKQPIHLVTRTQTCGTQEYLRDFVFGSVDMRDGLEEYQSNTQVLEKVRKDPLAIAICGKRSKSSKVKMLQLTAGKQLVPSDDAAILNGQYPLTRTLTLVIDTGRSDAEAIASQEFVRFALGQQGQVQTLVDGYYPIEPGLMRAGLAKLGVSQIR